MDETTLKRDNWLLKHRKNVASQFGEDGVLEKVFEIIPGGKERWCVEFGAGDGKWMSNTWNLIAKKNWHAVLIEADRRRYERLLVMHAASKKRITAVNTFVSFTGKDSLDGILGRTKIPREPDLISIDIDGNDYHIWDALKKYKPKVVIIEFNPSIPPTVDFAQPRDMMVRQGSSLVAMVRLGKTKGYELVYAQDGNAIFVLRKFFPAFGIKNNSVQNLYNDHKYETYVYQLFDGTLRYEGCDHLIWSGVKMNYRRLQVLPKYLRGFDRNGRLFVISLLRLLHYYEPHIKLSTLFDKKKLGVVWNNISVSKWGKK